MNYEFELMNSATATPSSTPSNSFHNRSACDFELPALLLGHRPQCRGSPVSPKRQSVRNVPQHHTSPSLTTESGKIEVRRRSQVDIQIPGLRTTTSDNASLPKTVKSLSKLHHQTSSTKQRQRGTRRINSNMTAAAMRGGDLSMLQTGGVFPFKLQRRTSRATARSNPEMLLRQTDDDVDRQLLQQRRRQLHLVNRYADSSNSRYSNASTTSRASSSNCRVVTISIPKKPWESIGSLKNHHQVARKSQRTAAISRKTKAAIQMQRCVRGWMQRLRYRVAYLQHMLARKLDQKQCDLREIEKQTQRRKVAYKDALLLQHKKEDPVKTAQLAKNAEITAFLRDDNRRMREKNEELALSLRHTKQQNDQLEERVLTISRNIADLNDFVEQETVKHVRLQSLMHRYQRDVATAQETLEQRRLYGENEFNIKLLYANLFDKIIARVEKQQADAAVTSPAALVIEVKALCLEADSIHKSESTAVKTF